jgi:uncharacterized repeat protein (TIGR03803 family)
MISFTRVRFRLFWQCGLIAAVCVGNSPFAAVHASSFITLYQFQGGVTGTRPDSGVVQDAAGVLYGETEQAGTTDCVTKIVNPVQGCGTLYSFSRTAGLKTLVVFNGANGAVGQNLPLLIGSTLYATAAGGGTNDKGVVFAIQTDGSGFKLLHSFSGSDGDEPFGPLVADRLGNLYGVTVVGGPAYPKLGYGVLYKIAPDGTFSVLHSFTNGADGANPTSLVIEKNGTIIGGAVAGGSYKKGNCLFVGCGTIYEFVPSKATFTVLQAFDSVNGASPVVGAVARNGTVLGISGDFFTLSPSGAYKVLSVTSGGDDAGYRSVAPILTPGPSLTSVSPEGLYNSAGTLYEQVGTILTVLHGFSGPDGAGPSSPPLLSSTGSLIGTTSAGGAACSCGTIYEYVP